MNVSGTELAAQTPASKTFAALRDQLADAAVAFAGVPGAAGDILAGMVD